MIEYKSELPKILLLTQLDNLEDQISSITESINEKDLAHFFVDSIYLSSVLHLIIDDYWIQSQNSSSEIQYDRFIKKFLSAELKPLLFLHAFFTSTDIVGLRTAKKTATQVEKFIVSRIKSKPADFQKIFLQISFQKMS